MLHSPFVSNTVNIFIGSRFNNNKERIEQTIKNRKDSKGIIKIKYSKQHNGKQ